MQQTVKMYEDGNRLILVFENANTGIKSLIQNMIGTVETKNVPNVTPVEIKEEPFVMNSASENVTDINEMKLIQEKGFEGLCLVYQFYKENASKLNCERSAKLKQTILYYMDYYKKMDVKNIPDNELCSILKIGAKYIFPKTMNSCLQQSGFISLDDFLASGRQNLEDAYLACFQVQ